MGLFTKQTVNNVLHTHNIETNKLVSFIATRILGMKNRGEKRFNHPLFHMSCVLSGLLKFLNINVSKFYKEKCLLRENVKTCFFTRFPCLLTSFFKQKKKEKWKIKDLREFNGDLELKRRGQGFFYMLSWWIKIAVKLV